MNYYINDNSARRGGIIAAIVYIVVVVSLVLWVKFDRLDPIDLRFGEIEVVFEDMVEGGKASEGVEGASSNETPDEVAAVNDVPPIQTQPTNSEVEIPVSGAKPEPSETPAPTAPTEPERVVNPNALFTSNPSSVSGGGSSQTSTASGSGAGTQGTGHSDVSFDLEGRSVVGGLARPAYNVQQAGIVVVTISVDQSGRVTLAQYRAEGSTTQNSVLRDAAIAAARSTRFSPSNNPTQTGTITYVFRLQ